MQKVLSATNQLPQHDTYKLFLKEHDPNYLQNLSAAKTASKNLLNSLLQMQVEKRFLDIEVLCIGLENLHYLS